MRETSLCLLDYVGIGEFASRTARYLSYGDQRRLEIARALEVSHRGYMMGSGNIVMNGNAKEMLDGERVRAAYLGER